MNYRINKNAVIVVVLLVGVAVALFAWTLVSAPTDIKDSAVQQEPVVSKETSQIITAKHQYRGGIHTVAGSVELPTPCHKVVVEPFFTEPDKKVELRFSTTMQGENCAQVLTPVPFKATFEAPESVEISAMWDSVSVQLNLVPVAPNESIDGEAYMKG